MSMLSITILHAFHITGEFKAGVHPIDCPVLCDYDHFTNSISTAQFPSQYVLKLAEQYFNDTTERYRYVQLY